jgi:BirA family biotin operon repressor/biotin-[acetyl-CoA-carboxylase] ligase
MKDMSSKAKLLFLLREKKGEPSSGQVLAKEMGISRVAVWKTVQSLVEFGYSIETGETGYLLNPKNEKDFLYPWEFGEKEHLFYHYKNTQSTMDRAREIAFHGSESGCIFTAEKQTAGRGRHGRTWVSRQGGLFFSILDRPNLTITDYTLFSLVMQIAVTRCISSICGKKAYLRWPNDIYIERRKISGITTEVNGEGDLIKWQTGGIGVNINNPVPSGKATSCAEILNRNIPRKEVLDKILDEIKIVKESFNSTAIYSQGNRALADEWNSLSDCIGAKAAIFEPKTKDDDFLEKTGNILARGVFEGIDPKGRCILKTHDNTLYFNQGSVSLAFINP